jgi:hemolysin activation/secretion protein
LFGTDAEGVVRLGTQLTEDTLPSLEQLSIGGVESVRGYRENRLVRDNGAVGSFELRIPLIHRSGHTELQLVPFVDAGYGWDVKPNLDRSVKQGGRTVGSSGEFISSVGIGLQYRFRDRVSADIYYGFPFKHFNDSERDLQDVGIHFSLTLWGL